jgi:hypothetical protein
MMHHILIGFLVLSIPKALFAGQSHDDSYVSMGLHSPSLDLSVANNGFDSTSPGGGQELHYGPESPLILSLGLAYGGLSGSLSQDLVQDESNKKLDYTDYRLAYYLDSFGIDAQYSEFLHFQLDSTSGLDESTISEDDRMRDDMALKNTAANIYWFPLKLNWRFDPAMDPARTDKQNGVGLGLVGTYNSLGISSKRGLIPRGAQSSFSPEGDIKKGLFQTNQAQVALAGTLTGKGVYLTTLLAAGQGEQKLKYETSNKTVEATGQAVTSIIHVVAGYVNKACFFDVSYRSDSPSFILKTITITTDRSEIVAEAGVKF